jgi:hypothetical protein
MWLNNGARMAASKQINSKSTSMPVLCVPSDVGQIIRAFVFSADAKWQMLWSSMQSVFFTSVLHECLRAVSQQGTCKDPRLPDVEVC